MNSDTPARLRVLIADDNPGVLKSVARLLALEYDVVGVVTNGTALLESVQQLQPDIIVNIRNIAYVELTGKGGANVHFVGKVKPLHLNANEAEALREYVSGDQVMDISKAA